MKFKFRRYYLYYLARAAIFFIYLLPANIGSHVAAFGGRIAYLILAKYRNITIENLTLAFGKERTPAEIRMIARRVFENLGRNAFELIQFPKINSANIDRIVTMRGAAILDQAFREGKGVVVLTAHFGNWELMPAVLRMKGYPGYAIGRRLYFDKYDAYLNRLRKVHDVNIIYRDESPRKMLRALRDNKIVGIVADQDVDSVDGVFVDFFGRKAYTPAGPAALAKASGAPIIPVLIMRENGRHTVVVDPPVGLVDTGDREKDLAENTQRWSNIIESYIRRYPDQWVWMHRRWKTKEGKS